jgi:predicted metal-dependent phosphotriesterase family hydrolase
MQVTTVRGPIAPSELGFTLMHEHLQLDLYPLFKNLDLLLNNEAIAADELGAFATVGGRTIVDLTNRGMRPDPQAVRRIAEAAGVNAVLGCGWYLQAVYDDSVARTRTNDLADELVRDLTEGIGGTDIRAGIIGEIGTDDKYIKPAEERVFRAAARAHKRTGAAITTHAMGYRVGLEQLDLLEEEGADLRRVVVGHCDHLLDIDYHEAILRRGAYVEYDNVGNRATQPDAQKVAMLVELLRRGYQQQLLLSMDACLRSRLHAWGGHGLDYLTLTFLPALRVAGATDEQIHTIMVENPARVLAI